MAHPMKDPLHLALPRDRALPDRQAPGERRPRPLLRGKRQPEGKAGGLRPRRSGRRDRAENAALLPPPEVPDRPVRPARLGEEHAVPRASRTTRRGTSWPTWRRSASTSGSREVAGLRRLVGLDARTRLRRNPPRARQRAGDLKPSSMADYGKPCTCKVVGCSMENSNRATAFAFGSSANRHLSSLSSVCSLGLGSPASSFTLICSWRLTGS